MNRLLKFLVAGFPSPWRWLRRRYWRCMYRSMSPFAQYLANAGHIDPESLIKRGEL